ncbi:peptide chain release factor N(5)-glutamine methyltransferase [Christiangramia fulva]|uniref:Release factor glutamine methyltransferase n=1 Tax=Christiangramia fulva TaxID=2126553 RepID=A0A2R3Z0V2_9FLAO|nr:peptide chain release factor N(5)-glutamine methyltransferase [Christiangramia fulva]AVR43885.1 peptide chain release factor N(5)-glutamine methyltransferase [Christiangramia fulva]
MRLSQLKLQFIDHLKDGYPSKEIESFFNILAEKYLGMTRLEVALAPELALNEEQLSAFESALKRLKQHEPVQYITGETEFFGLHFLVDKNVLIPRPETEELVDWIIQDNKELQNLKILDIGTGSGCIAISLAKNLKAEVTAFDISEAALKTARKNAKLNKVDVDFRKLDILKLEKLQERYDIIVSNPPYVREQEKEQMQKNVLDHEPKTALFVDDDDALIFYKKIAELAQVSLRQNGALYFEINQYLHEETRDLVENLGFEAELKKDIFGNYRMLKAVR